MHRRNLILIAITVVVTAVFIRLGFWQLQRLHDRRAQNALILSRLEAAPAPFVTLTDTATAEYRMVRLNGRWDYDHEIALTFRSRDGSPGVNLVTPLLMSGNDTAVLVNRGWVYSPDAMTVDHHRWREADTGTVIGYVRAFSPGTLGEGASTTHTNDVRRLDRDAIAPRLPYPVMHMYVVQVADSVAPPGQPNIVHAPVVRHAAEPDSAAREHPVRLPLPELDEGPHRFYAIQWFSFALIAVVGMFTILLSKPARTVPDPARISQ